MKGNTIGLVFLLALSGSFCLAQMDQPTIKEDFVPSSLNQPGQQYPQVNYIESVGTAHQEVQLVE